MEEKMMLIVDDIEATRGVLAECFCADFSILQAGGGHQAIRLIEEYADQISMILLDIVMPDLDGIAVLKWLGASQYAAIPVIAVTAEPGYQQEALENGAWDFIAKPEDNRVIQIRVNNALGRYALERERRHSAGLTKAKLEMDNLVNSIPGGIAKYSLTKDGFHTLYFSDGVAQLSGHTREEYAQRVQDDASAIIYEEDRPRLVRATMETFGTGKPVDETYRIYHKDGSLVWVHLNGTLIGKEHGVQILHAVFQRPAHMAQLYDNLVNESQNIIYVSDVNNYDLLYVNHTGLKAIGKETDYSGRKCHEFLFGWSSPCPFCKVAQMCAQSYLERDFTYSENGRIYSMRGKLTDWNGLSAHVEYIEDVTQTRKAEQQSAQAQRNMDELRKKAQDALDRYEVLVNTVPGGIAQYEVRSGKVLTRFFSDGICALTGYPREERERMSNQNILSVTYPEDLPLLTSAIQAAVSKQKNLDITYRIRTKSGEPRWVHLNAAHSAGPQGECLYQAVYTDVDKLKRLEQELLENQLRYESAIKGSGINIWEYDIQRDSLYVVFNSARIKQTCFHIENYIQSTLDHGYVREDSIALFLGIFERLRQGEREVTEDIWYKTNNEAGWWCERITYTAAFDDVGKPCKAFGAGRDVTREKEAEKKFYEEMSYRKAIQRDNLASATLDLTDDRVLEMSSSFSAALNLRDGTAEQYFAQTEKLLADEACTKEYSRLFNKQNLLHCFTNGEYALSMELTRRFDTNQVYWVNYSVHLLQNPETKHVVAHVSGIDITPEKVMQTIMETIVKSDYDSFAVVDGSLDSALDYGVEARKHLYDPHRSFEAQIEALIRSLACPEDVERTVSKCKIDHIWQRIKDGGTYRFSFGMRMPDGQVRRKQLQFTAISSPRKTFLMSRVDVNDIYQEQRSAKEKLQQALSAAEQANHAKTIFLSRMSHDIRTPMNAVISLAALGQDSQSVAEAQDYLKKIGTSGQYLLAIINDVLDLSKMENHRVELHPEAVFLPDFIGNTVAIVMPTAKEKQIDLQVRQLGTTSQYMKLDTTYVRQVAVNLLSNAIKFTPNGGRVELILENRSREGRFVRNRMTVKDNGIGISAAFLPRVFSPFEQENAQNDTTRQGTGLGLSIVKSIVERMGGKIWVESSQGCGSAFYVEWMLEAASAEDVRQSEQKEDAPALSVLAGKRILMAEDHPLNAEIAQKLLSKRALIVDTVPDGSAAVERFCAAAPGYYAAILMDIRMPRLNGLEATRAIRALDRPDAKTIPIIAMTANAFDDDVRQSIASGMNAHLAKPIDPQRLYQTLAEWIAGERESGHESVR